MVGIVSICQKGSGKTNGLCNTIWIDMDTPNTGSTSPTSEKSVNLCGLISTRLVQNKCSREKSQGFPRPWPKACKITNNVLSTLILYIVRTICWNMCTWSRFKHHFQALFGNRAMETTSSGILKSNCCFLFEKCAREAVSPGASRHDDSD